MTCPKDEDTSVECTPRGGTSGRPAVYPDSNFPMARDSSEGYRARGDTGPQRYCFIGRPRAKVLSQRFLTGWIQ